MWIWVGYHCGAPTAAATGVLMTLVEAERTGEPVKGPRAVEAGKAEIPEGRTARATVRKPISNTLFSHQTNVQKMVWPNF